MPINSPIRTQGVFSLTHTEMLSQPSLAPYTPFKRLHICTKQLSFLKHINYIMYLKSLDLAVCRWQSVRLLRLHYIYSYTD